MIKNNQKEIILLKDLGYLFPTEKSSQKCRFALYKCHCGTEFRTQPRYIANGHTKSCGCYNRQRLSESKTKHGLAYHRIYKVWCDMVSRCNNNKCISYKYYGARGITVCERWLKVENFIEDMYPSFEDGLTLDRENNDLGYSPDNCRWVLRNIQSRNSRKLNRRNKSGYRGVHFTGEKWKTQIVVNNKGIYLGIFTDIIDAAKAYDKYIIDNNLEHTKNFN